MTIVAKTDAALSPSVRATRYGRITSPARAGSIASAAKPTMVARNTGPKRVGPIGSSRYRQRNARMTGITAASTTAQIIRSTRACAISAATADKFARLRNHAKRAIARSVTSAVRIVIRGDLHNISGSFRALAGTVAYGCE